MIKEYVGDVLNAEVDIIAHQTNCKGVMGAGVAKQIKDRLLSVEEFEKYVNICKSSDPFGACQILKTLKHNLLVANLFGERIPTGRQQDTDYKALENAISQLVKYANDNNYKKIAIPGLLGCGLAGGDWKIVRAILDKYFKHSDLELQIVWFTLADFNKWHMTAYKAMKEIPANVESWEKHDTIPKDTLCGVATLANMPVISYKGKAICDVDSEMAAEYFTKIIIPVR